MAHGHQHNDGHNHSHSHAVSAAQAGSRAFIIGIALNLAYVIAESAAGFRTHSLALLTDAGHNLSDVASLALSLVAFRLAKVKPTQTFTYGYKKSTVLAALVNAVILLIAVGVLGYEAAIRIRHPQPMEGGIIAWVAGAGILVNGASAMLFMRDRHELNAKGAYLHLMGDAAVSLGTVVAGIVIIYTHWYWLDTAVSVLVLAVILISTWSLLTDSLRLSLDAVPRNVSMEEVQEAIEGLTDVQSVSHIHLWAMSTTENALTAHVSVAVGSDQYAVIKAIRHELRHHNVQHVTIEIVSLQDAMPKSCDSKSR